ncbi:MAG: hypothetical protein LUF92_05385 [Clostridiales bacterium]|nr:hypothetical protein [Clostridiales bacterium]
MTTLTLNRNLNTEDLFVAMNNSAFADLRASWDKDCSRMNRNDSQISKDTWGNKIKSLFSFNN